MNIALIRLLCLRLVAGLSLVSHTVWAAEPLTCTAQDYLGPRQIEVGDIVFNIPKGQCVDLMPGRKLRNIGQGIDRDPFVIGPYEYIRIWHPYMWMISGTNPEGLTEVYSLSLLISEIKEKSPANDSWCNWQVQQRQPGRFDIEKSYIVDGLRVFGNDRQSTRIPIVPMTFFSAPVILNEYESPHNNILNYDIEVALSRWVSLHLTFDSQDLRKIDFRKLMGNIEQNIRGWIDHHKSAPLLHNTSQPCESLNE